MTADQLQHHLLDSVHSVHALSQLREHTAALRGLLYRSTPKKIDAYLLEKLPEQFSFLAKLISDTNDTTQKEKLLELVEKILGSFETLYLQLPYSPTENQLRDYKKALAGHLSQPFVIKVELNPSCVGSITWECAGTRHTSSVFSSSESTST